MSGRKKSRREFSWRICREARKAYLARSHRDCPFCNAPPRSFMEGWRELFWEMFSSAKKNKREMR